MGNDCLKDNTVQQAEAELQEKGYKKRDNSNIKGVYSEQLKADRKQMIESKEARNQNDIIKLEQLKRNLKEFESTNYDDKNYDFKHRKFVAEIDGLEKIIKTRNDEIQNIKSISAKSIESPNRK